MLTGDLVRVRSYKGALRPQFISVEDDTVMADAGWLCALVQDGLGQGATRGSLQAAIKDAAQIRPDHKCLKGLAKVLLDSASFGVDCPVEPVALREKVFLKAAEMGPLALTAGPLERATAEDVLALVGQELGLTAEQVRAALYADRKEEAALTACPIPEPAALVARYNTALVQAVLLKATKVEVQLKAPTAPKIRQLLRYVKFHQLMHQATRKKGVLTLIVDGPESVLKQSTRYGMKLATFFPAVLLQNTWSLKADIAWTRGKKTLEIDHKAGLISHYKDRGGYESREAKWFRDRFKALDTGWTLRPGAKPIDLGGRAVVMPDFTFTREGKTAHLEIIGYWRSDYLARRVEWLQKYGPGNLVLAVSKRLVADKSVLEGFEGVVIPFAEIVNAKKVLAAVETIAR